MKDLCDMVHCAVVETYKILSKRSTKLQIDGNQNENASPLPKIAIKIANFSQQMKCAMQAFFALDSGLLGSAQNLHTLTDITFSNLAIL